MTSRTARPRTDDPRFQRSFKALIDAVVAELDRGPLSDLPITRVVESAGVTRPTFYQHFADVPDAARRAALSRLSAAFPMPEPLRQPEELQPQAIRERIERQAEPILTHLFEHKDFYLRVLDGAANMTFFEEIVSFVAMRLLPEIFEPAARRGTVAQQDLTLVMASGITLLIIRWLRDETNSAPRSMAHRLSALALTLMAPDS